ncbi:MAG: RagB/SusD family nutrient uptake outer membrane protein [Chitinophagaceae bacterium]|nr:RagB/SusD family nutrient uptake outer membrane protein [Chitinophagaceae bacterium]
MKKIFDRYDHSWWSPLFLALLLGSCKKNDLLNAKPQTSLVIPTTIQDFQAILDYSETMNIAPSLGEASADNYYLPYDRFQSAQPIDQNTYIWARDIFGASTNIDDWNYPYQQVFNANVVLDGLAKMKVTTDNQQDIHTLTGYALFYRAYAFFNIAQLFAPPYDSATAATDPGIPLRLASDITIRSKRSSVKDSYERILDDLHQASRLAPAALPTATRNRPSGIAAYACLARVYQSMRAYKEAGAAADSALRLYSKLIDYNNVTPSFLPFRNNNDETIFQSNFSGNALVLVPLAGIAIIDSNLYNSYASNDLRRTIYFNASTGPGPRGGYSGSLFTFSGLATDELYLIRAESFARAGQTDAAMTDLNTLLAKRFSAPFSPYTATDAADALGQVLTERRKELELRGGLRWMDLRRLNKEGYNITLTRVLNGQTYTLPPNSPLYTLPIPPNVINLSGIQQNNR